MVTGPSQPPGTITVSELRSHIEEGRVQLVDVRLPFDYFGGRIPGALNLPRQTVVGRLGQIPADRHLVLICDDGRESHAAGDAARAAGFLNVSVLLGGYDAWLDAGLPTETISAGVTPQQSGSVRDPGD